MDVDVAQFENMVRVADRYGPFMFAILFTLVISRIAYGYYNAANTRTNPRPTKEEVRTYRFYFLCNLWCGVLLVFVSIGWWFVHETRRTHIYQFAIVALNEGDDIYSEYFYRIAPRPQINNGVRVHDRYFLVVRSDPFRIGDRLNIDFFSQGSQAPTRLTIEYTGHEQDAFTITRDGDKLELKTASLPIGVTPSFFASEEILGQKMKFTLATQLMAGPGDHK